ncbi:heme-degrading domain-containing protein [Microbacterium sp. kSW2-24]|uniref:heme-degrading domain-containing protein n=1 Tax=Microbacterium TaxID=33882 RepID=UPI001FFCE130|nr:heme-degrading domain-containing protein [Microbacterium galbinum]MCK2022529.1 heme-degrading domain-containing protein [Microbacterium galbinum]
MSIDAQAALDAITAEERELDVDRFTVTDAWEVGAWLRARAVADALPIVVSVVLGGQRAFHMAAPGTSALNDAWLERKFRVVEHFGRSSLGVHYDFLSRGEDFERSSRLDPALYAAAGGGFPIRIGGTLAGAIGVSGLEMHADHALVVEALRAHLSR